LSDEWGSDAFGVHQKLVILTLSEAEGTQSHRDAESKSLSRAKPREPAVPSVAALSSDLSTRTNARRWGRAYLQIGRHGRLYFLFRDFSREQPRNLAKSVTVE